MNQDRQILRELANRYAQAAADPVNEVKAGLHRAVNDRKQIRPVVLIDEIPWNEMNRNGELTLCCEDPDYREAEDFMRKTLYKWEHMPADMIISPYYKVRKLISTTGIGIAKVEEIRMTGSAAITSHHYTNQLTCEEDLERIHREVITYRKEESEAKFLKMADAFGDIVPVKLCGLETGYGIGCKTWDTAAELMGAEDLLIGLADDPDLMHLVAAKFTDIFCDGIRQYENLNLLEPNQLYVHSTAGLATDLTKDIDFNHVTAKNVWGRGLAQIFASVSKAMRDEFDIRYMKKAMEPFGLVYYGCCEPLHNMVDILEQMPNLRKISITPWADVDVAADAIGGKYVLSSKPNPAYAIDVDRYEGAIREEIGRVLAACKRNGCSCDIVLKDISNVSGRPENLFRWEKIAMELVEQY